MFYGAKLDVIDNSCKTNPYDAVANFANTKQHQKAEKLLKPWHVGYSSESTHQEQSNE